MAEWTLRGAALLACTLAALHLGVDDRGPLIIAVHATAGWWWLGGLGLLALAAWARDPVALALSTLATGCALAWTLPGTLRAAPVGDGPGLTVAVANVLSSNPEADAAIATMAAEEPDAIAIVELSPGIEARLGQLLPTARWPARTALARPDNFGIALVAARGTPPVEVGVAQIPWLASEVDGVEILAVHTLPPITVEYRAVWAAQLRFLAERAADGRPRVVLGDLNLTRHNPSFALLTRSGLDDAFARAGRAAQRTWTPLRSGPDLARLDHVLISGLEVRAIRTLPRHGSDHRGILAELTRLTGSGRTPARRP